MVTIRNWRDCAPTVGHETAIIFSIFRAKGRDGLADGEATLEGLDGFTLHMMQGGKSGDYHQHEDAEQVYYFTKGHGKMKIDDVFYDVKQGDTVHVPPKSRHQLVNDSDDWIEHLLITAKVYS